MCECHAPWLADCGIAARHGDVIQMGEAIEPVEMCDEYFPTPDAAVDAVAGAVERESDHRTFDGVLGHAGRDVRVMMLDGDGAKPAFFSPLLCPCRREVAGMRIVHDHLRSNFERVHQVRKRLGEEIEA